MILNPPYPSPPIYERILLYGEAGTSKTTSILDLARFLPASTFHILDTDASLERMLYGKSLGNVRVHPVNTWEDYQTFVDKLTVPTYVGANDWICIDMVSSAWVEVQNYFTAQIFKQSMGQYYLQQRIAMEEANKKAMSVRTQNDWPVINSLYRDFISPLVLRQPCHLLATASMDRIDERFDDPQTQSQFARHGGKPAGQKHLPFQFHSILKTAYNPSTKQWLLTTVKDREREPLSAAPLLSFTRDYLINVANWSFQ
jgi:hypothetical protein